MKNNILLILILHFAFIGTCLAQKSKHPSMKGTVSNAPIEYKFEKFDYKKQSKTANQTNLPLKSFESQKFQRPTKSKGILHKRIFEGKKTPSFLKGNLLDKNLINSDYEKQAFQFLDLAKEDLLIKDPQSEFSVSNIEIESNGRAHVKMNQQYNGIPIWAAEIILHAQSGLINKMNGNYIETPQIDGTAPKLSAQEAFDIALSNVASFTSIDQKTVKQNENVLCKKTASNLVYLPTENKDDLNLCWHVVFHPNVRENWAYFIDATDGSILRYYKNSCSLHANNFTSGTAHKHSSSCNHGHSNFKIVPKEGQMPGPEVANATDLLGVTRTINTYSINGDFFLIDGSRSMFNLAQSNLPNEPVGAIWTIDGNNTSPQGSNFTTSHVATSNNSWGNERTGVSAHYNAGEAYDYFREVHNRNSINGRGGNIVSIINVTDQNGASMENAFWNGQAMFYGNGGNAFEPLAKALDVAGHELSHGVIQSTANLEYVSQSGALNESFADIFGAMIDRDDWKLGEDVVNTSVFPSGALRDLQNPNNGGSSLNDAGWQPKNMSQYQTLPNTPQGDFGGVHINSGIPNHAYYQLATQIGKDKSEDIFYRCLTKYMTKSSQFVDLRIGAEQSAIELFGNGSTELDAVKSAFDIVQIGGGTGTNQEIELETNPGEDLILVSDANLSELYVVTPDASNVTLISETDHISKPSITDDGSVIVFVAADNRMHLIEMDYNSGVPNEIVLENQPIWRNVVISKDGTKFAAITDNINNDIIVYDFISQTSKTFTLFNPTFTAGVSTGDVKYADVMEFDHSGEYLIYDAYNEINSSFDGQIDYWDIGIIEIWNNSTASFTDGKNIQKLFNGLPENTSVGNPTFAKNATYVVAFDFIDEEGDASIIAVNLETGETSDPPIFENIVLNYPNYSVNDRQMLFDAQDQDGNIVLGRIDINSDFLNSDLNSAVIFIDGGQWGVWYGLGDRELVALEATSPGLKLKLSPNPSQDIITIDLDGFESGDLGFEIIDGQGRSISKELTQVSSNPSKQNIDISHLIPGTYILRINQGPLYSNLKFIKVQP